MPDGGSTGKTSTTCLSNASMSGKARAGTDSKKSKTVNAARARIPITAILWRIKPSSVSSRLQRQRQTRGAKRVSQADLDLGIRSCRVREAQIDLVQTGKTRRNSGVQNQAGMQRGPVQQYFEIGELLQWRRGTCDVGVYYRRHGFAQPCGIEYDDVARPRRRVQCD